jgi:lysophospholipase-3
MIPTRRSAVTGAFRLILAAVLLTAALPASALAKSHHESGLTPIVLFPAFHFTKLRVSVHHQAVDASCPRNGTFEDWFPLDKPSATFSQVCQDELLTLRFDAKSHKPLRRRFHEQHGVKVSIIDYGKTASAPFYEPMYEALEAAGYTRDRNIRVAGYDARLTPDMGDFVRRTKKLIEQTYRDNGNRPVHLTGHSNGPIYAEYLLTHTSAAWKHKYIHGFSPIAGNLPGQGGIWFLLFTGLNVADFTLPTTVENARSSARLYLSAPSTYLSAADPKVFGNVETVLADASTGRSYTPVDFRSILRDAGVARRIPIADRYVGFLHMSRKSSFPNVDVYAEKGSGIETLVGIGLPDLTRGQLLGADATFFTRDGDINQEDITNEAIGAWAAMPCFHFSLTDNPGVDHFSLPGNADVLARLIANANAPRSNC